MPMAAYGVGEQLGIEQWGGQETAPFQAGAAISFDFGLDHGDGAQAGEAGFAWKAPGS